MTHDFKALAALYQEGALPHLETLVALRRAAELEEAARHLLNARAAFYYTDMGTQEEHDAGVLMKAAESELRGLLTDGMTTKPQGETQ